MTEKFEDSLVNLSNAAFEKATFKAIERAEQTGTPVIVWEKGQVTRLDPKTARSRMATRLDRKEDES